MIILDSDVLSAAMHSDPLVIGWLDRQPSMSIWTTAITVLEIRFGLASMPVGRRQAERELAFARSIEEKLERRVLPFDHSAAEEAASLMTTRRRVGRPRELRDTMIAAIAITQRATLATRNVRHFDDVDVPIVNPWKD